MESFLHEDGVKEYSNYFASSTINFNLQEIEHALAELYENLVENKPIAKI